jgi:putative membrane protein
MLFTTTAALVTLLTPRPAQRLPSFHAPADAVAVRIALDDPTIVAIYDAANTADIETGQLGGKKGSSAKVRDFGMVLVSAHTAARQQGRDLAKKLGVTPTPPKDDKSGAEHAAVMKRLGALSGVAFDRAFLEHEIAYHKAVIAAVQGTLLPAIQNADLKALVVKVAPVFVQHQQMAERLLASLPAGN